MHSEPFDGDPAVSSSWIENLLGTDRLRTRLRRILIGLRAPRHTRAHKWARLQLLRLWAVAAGFVTPCLAVLLVMLLAMVRTEPPPRQFSVTIEKIEPPPPLREPPKEDLAPPPPDLKVEIPRIGNADFEKTVLVPHDSPPTPETVPFRPSPIVVRIPSGPRRPTREGVIGTVRNTPTEGAVLRALRWLKKNQNEDGSWPQTKPAMTGLALLCFLAHAETPASAEFGQTVEYAIRWLCDRQEGDGGFAGRDSHDYSHPIATYALCEAYSLTRIPAVRDAARKAVLRIVNGQHANGGFNYNLNNADRDDTSYMGWCAQALKAAKIAEVLDTEETEKLDAAIKKAIQGFRQNYKELNSGYGAFGYTGPGDTGLTGAGTLCLQLLGAANSPQVQNALANMEDCTFNWDGRGKYNQNYYWYYITQAKFHAGGATWNVWNRLFSPALCKNQTVIPNAIEGPDGKMKDIGYWEMERALSGHTDQGEGARVMNTCLACLQLEVYYRFLPSFQLVRSDDELRNAPDHDARARIAIRGI